MKKSQIIDFINSVFPGMMRTLIKSYEDSEEEVTVFSSHGSYIFSISFGHEDSLGEIFVCYSLD